LSDWAAGDRDAARRGTAVEANTVNTDIAGLLGSILGELEGD